MSAAARHLRALVLIVTALMAAGGESLALPVAHLFADHDHEIVFSVVSGTWEWVAPDDHHGDPASLAPEHHGHSEAEFAVAAPLHFGKTTALSHALTPIAVLDPDRMQRTTRSHGCPDAIPDVGKPDLALLATMRV